MSTRSFSDTQWSGHGGWQWTWRGWDRWPDGWNTWWGDSGQSQGDQVDELGNLNNHVEVAAGQAMGGLDTMDGVNLPTSDGQGSNDVSETSRAAAAAATHGSTQNLQHSSTATGTSDPWWSGSDPWQSGQSVHEASRRTSWADAGQQRGDGSVHEASWRPSWNQADWWNSWDYAWNSWDGAYGDWSWNPWERGHGNYKGDYSDPPAWPGGVTGSSGSSQFVVGID